MTAESKEHSDSSRPPGSGAGTGPYVVGIGASAGGLDALKTFFGTVPAQVGLSFVVVLHLAPDHESRIVELLQPYTRLRVLRIKDSTPIEPDCVYVIPPNANLSAIDTHLRLSKLEEERAERAPIDHFFRTLALTHDGRAVGVVLTGAGSDGALGIRQIKEHGGLTISQDPVEAEFDAMPRSAIETGTVDLVLPLRDISEQIVKFCTTRPELPLPDDDGEIDDRSRALLDEILAQIHLVTGHELAVYKRDLLLKRIRRRMQLRHVATLAEYLDMIRHQARETRALASDLMLIITEFFSGGDFYEALERRVVPHLFDVKSRADDKIRAWSIGCATGEEAYSLAMLMLEERERRTPQPLIQVFASDMSDDMLRRARNGVYPQEIAETVSRTRLQRFFDKIDDGYRVRKELRDAIVFASHDLYRDPPFAHLDLIVCRGLLRELNPDVRQGVLKLFAYVLEPHGELVVSADDPVEDSTLFVRNYEAENVRVFHLADGRHTAFAARPSGPARRHAALHSARDWSPRSPSASELHAQLIARHMPASVLVDEQNNVIHYSASAGRFLRLPGGQITHQLTKLVARPLRRVLHDLIDAARREGKPVASGPITFDTDHGSVSTVVHAEPAGQGPRSIVLLVFEENAPAAAEATATTAAPSDEALYRIRQLESDLDRANQQLHFLLAEASVREAAAPLDASSTNAAEHLVGTLGDLESSRKELQSLNNELQRLDRENNLRLQELAKLSIDLKRLLESTGIATLFLDRDLRILRFTPEMRGIFNLKDTDRGRRLEDLKHGLQYETLAADAARVIEHLAPVEREVEGAAGRCFLSRLLPYRATPYSIDGVVLTLVDITNAKRAEQELRDRDRRKDEFLALLAHELRNPLAPIITGVEVLRRTAGTGVMTEPIIATIARQAKLLVRLVDDLLDVSRVTGGRLRLRLAPVKLADAVSDALASVRPLIDSAQHELVVRVTDEPIVLKADAARLTQVLANLLNNAARYTPNSGLIELTAQREGDQAVIKVKDNGYGIPPQNVPHVFEMFYQGDDPRTARQSGLGIGLTLAKSLMEMHGGTIVAESGGIDRGSVFTLRLPIPAEVPAAVAAPKARTAAISGHRVLIVDDNADAARTLESLIHTLGDNDVHVELSGAAALAMVVDFRPDVVIVDLKMPEMDGYEVARRMRAQPGGNDILLVALTGWALDEHKRRSQAAGFDHHLTKPADRESLEALLAGSRPRPRLPPAEVPKTLH